MVVSVKQYHREFLRSGADVMQAFNFYSTQEKIDMAAGDLEPPNVSGSLQRVTSQTFVLLRL